MPRTYPPKRTRVSAPGCRLPLTVTDADRAAVVEIAANGGTLDLLDFAHTRQYEKQAMAWARRAAEQWIRREPKFAGGHAHDDGSVYLPRSVSDMAVLDSGSPNA